MAYDSERVNRKGVCNVDDGAGVGSNAVLSVCNAGRVATAWEVDEDAAVGLGQLGQVGGGAIPLLARLSEAVDKDDGGTFSIASLLDDNGNACENRVEVCMVTGFAAGQLAGSGVVTHLGHT